MILYLIDLLDLLVMASSGWRYLLSPSYRAETNRRLSKVTRIERLLELLGGGLVFLISLLCMVFVVAYLAGLLD